MRREMDNNLREILSIYHYIFSLLFDEGKPLQVNTYHVITATGAPLRVWISLAISFYRSRFKFEKVE